MSRISSVKACIINSGLPKAQREELINSLDTIGFDSETGKLTFSDEAVARLVDEALEKELLKYQKGLFRTAKQIESYVRLEEAATRALMDGGRDEPVWQLLDSILDMDGTGYATEFGFHSIPQMAHVILHDTIAPAGKAYALFREGFFGATNNRAEMDRVAEMIFNNSFDETELGQAAKALADVIESFRKQLNDAGADVPKRAGYLMPQEHRSSVVLSMGRDAWKKYIKENAKVYNPQNGAEFRGDDLDAALDIMYENVTSGRPDAPMIMYDVDGQKMSAGIRMEKIQALQDELARVQGDEADKIMAKLQALENGKAVGVDGNYISDMPIHAMRSQERNIQFTTFKAWKDYNAKMGVDDTFAAIHSNFDSMANEIAMMRTFGPDAEKGYKYLRQKAEHHHPDKKQELGRFGGQKTRWLSKSYRSDAKWNVITGKINKGGGGLVARFVAALGNWATSAFLGAASIPAALGDPATGAAMSSAMGMGVRRYISNYAGQVTRGRSAAMVELGMGAAGLVNGLKSMNRFAETEKMTGWSAKAADFFTRLSLLQHLTKAGDEAMPLSVLQTIARYMNVDYDALPTDFKSRFWEAFGMNEEDWADISSVKDALVYIDGDALVTNGGSGTPVFNLRHLDAKLDPQRATELRQKVMYAIETMRDYSLLKGNTAARAFTTGGLEQGSGWGIAARALTQFATHPMTMATGPLTLAFRLARHEDSYKYMAALAVGTTVAGAMIVQAKALSAGRDPEDMTESGFWLQAFAKGGGGGFYADMVLAVLSGEEGVVSKIVGPRVRVLTEGMSPINNAIDAAYNGKSFDRYMAETISDLSGISPLATNAATLGVHRAFIDAAIEMFDPKMARDRRRRMIRYYEKERGSGFWWQPDDYLPSEMPNAASAIGED